jgi:CRISPR-associated protein GSU0053 (Cas_GSU0053)
MTISADHDAVPKPFRDADALIAACSEESADAGITIMSVLEPLGGPGSPVKPASYEGGRFQADRRWWGCSADRRQVEVLVIDNEPSQANRLEAALEQRRAELGLPEIMLDLTSVGTLRQRPLSCSTAFMVTPLRATRAGAGPRQRRPRTTGCARRRAARNEGRGRTPATPGHRRRGSRQPRPRNEGRGRTPATPKAR